MLPQAICVEWKKCPSSLYSPWIHNKFKAIFVFLCTWLPPYLPWLLKWLSSWPIVLTISGCAVGGGRYHHHRHLRLSLFMHVVRLWLVLSTLTLSFVLEIPVKTSTIFPFVSSIIIIYAIMHVCGNEKKVQKNFFLWLKDSGMSSENCCNNNDTAQKRIKVRITKSLLVVQLAMWNNGPVLHNRS